MRPLWIYGVMPQPAGGVATFVERLVTAGIVPIAGVIDPHYGRKNPTSVSHIYAKRPNAIARARVLLALLKLRDSPLLINASQPRAVLYLAPLLRRRGGDTFLILHHGVLRSPSNPVIRYLTRKALAKYFRIGCLSQQQEDFYRSIGVPENRLFLLNNYISPRPAKVDFTNGPLAQVIRWLNRTKGPLVVSSGYAQPYYHHDWLLDEMGASGNLDGIRYLICCYGPETRLLGDLRVRASGSKSSLVVYGLSSAEFDYVLDNANVYIRPTDVDSFGIAVWDAAGKGLAVVASDVCTRPPTAFVHRRGDRVEFAKCLRLALSGARREADAVSPWKDRIDISQFLDPEYAAIGSLSGAGRRSDSGVRSGAEISGEMVKHRSI